MGMSASQGTLFADKVGEPIKINEIGGYIQIAKSLFSEKLRLLASGRYDKNENFEGRFTPRVTALFKPAKNHNIRFSYQTAYRFPSTQMQWINLFVGNDYLLIGGVKDFRSYYSLNSSPVYAIQNDVVTNQGQVDDLLESLLQANLWDEAMVFKSKYKTLGDGIKAPAMMHGQLHDIQTLGPDHLLHYRN